MVKRIFISVILLAVIALVGIYRGCSGLFVRAGLFERASLSKAEYIKRFFPTLESEKSFEIDFYYRGAVGGYGTIARIRGPEALVKRLFVGRQDYFEADNDMIFFMLRERFKEIFGEEKLPDWAKVDQKEGWRLIKRKKGGNSEEIFLMGNHREFFFVGIGR